MFKTAQVLINALSGWRAISLCWLGLMGAFTAWQTPDQPAWLELAGPDWDFMWGVCAVGWRA